MQTAKCRDATASSYWRTCDGGRSVWPNVGLGFTLPKDNPEESVEIMDKSGQVFEAEVAEVVSQ
jgi:hypothetical protein